MKKRQTLMRKVTYLTMTATLLTALCLAITCVIFIVTRTNSDYQSIARAASTHSLSWIEQLDDGDYSYDESSGKVFKGKTEITDNAFWFIQNDNKNMHHTFFWGKTRVMSDLTDADGNSVVGTTLDNDNIWNAVCTVGYYTENNVKIAGNPYTVCYVPVKNGDEVVGMVFTGVNQASAYRLIKKDVIICIIITAVLVLIAGLLASIILFKWSKGFKNNLQATADIATEKNTNVTDFGNQTNETMSQINTAVDQVTIAVTEQASHTEEIMGSMEEFGANIDIIVNNVENTSEIAKESISAINELQDQLTVLESASAENSNQITAISAQIEEDGKAVASIAKITDVINDIAFQITILSYNAAVEAAHAGEFGKSFAVVADSIKDLSDKTKASLEDITNIINDVNEKMAATGEASIQLVAENNKVAEQLAATRTKLNDVTESYHAIIENIEKVMDQSSSIETAKNQVVETVSSLAAMGEENAAMSEEMKASSDEVISLTQSLLEEIASLTEINDIIAETQANFS